MIAKQNKARPPFWVVFVLLYTAAIQYSHGNNKIFHIYYKTMEQSLYLK